MSRADNVCLACLGTKKILNIFDTYECDGIMENYLEMLSSCFSVKIFKGSAVNSMCAKCILFLREAYQFKQKMVENVEVIINKACTDIEYLDEFESIVTSYENNTNDPLITNELENYSDCDTNEKIDEENISKRIKKITKENKSKVMKKFNKEIKSNQNKKIKETNKTEIAKYFCDECDEQFRTKHAMSIHMREHLRPAKVEVEECLPFRKNQELFKIGEYFYNVVSRRHERVLVKCVKAGCGAKLWIKKKIAYQSSLPNHNHDPDSWIEDRNALYHELKIEVEKDNGENSLNQIYQRVAERHPIGKLHLTYRRMESSMRRWRRSSDPAIPDSLPGYEEALRRHPVFQYLVLGGVTVKGDRAVALAMPDFVSCLTGSDCILVDPVFKKFPEPLQNANILALHSIIGDYYYDAVVVIMESRNRELYHTALDMVWTAAGKPKVQAAVCGHDGELQQVVRAVLGVQAKGNYYHFAQALVSKAQWMGLDVRRNKSPGTRLVQLYAALALLPTEHIAQLASDIPVIALHQNLPFHLEFHHYFTEQWLDKVGASNFSTFGNRNANTLVCQSFQDRLFRTAAHQYNVWQFTSKLHILLQGSNSRFLRHIQRGDGMKRARVQHLKLKEFKAYADVFRLGQITLIELFNSAIQAAEVDGTGEETSVKDEHSSSEEQ